VAVDESTPIIAAVAAAASAILVKAFDTLRAARKDSHEVAFKRQEFVVTLLAQEKARYDALIADYRAADKEERHAQRARIAVLEAQVFAITRERDEAREELDARREQLNVMRRRYERGHSSGERDG
jgi:chromosome segregation ATPase